MCVDFKHNDLPVIWNKFNAMKQFFNVTSAALNDNVIDRVSKTVERAKKAVAEKHIWVDFLELLQCDMW